MKNTLFSGFFIALSLTFSSSLFSQTPPPKVTNLIRGGDMEAVTVESNPWDGVSNGTLRVFSGNGNMVNTNGQVTSNPFPASIQAGDLNGDGLKDILVADSQGYFWIYFNKGTKTEPKFTRAELLPFWLKGVKTPKISMVDVNADGLLDLVIGDFVGKLYIVKNTGTASAPKFSTGGNLKDLEIKTESSGKLWCNYLAPCYFDWDGDGKLDLIMGEGTFSANSVFFLKNNGSNEKPSFDPPKRMLHGEGKEHLVPQVIDWNQDGKPDLIVGEREKATINCYLNSETLPLGSPKVVKIGTSGATSTLANPCFVDLNDDGLPDLLISSPTGQIRIAINKGSKGVNLFDKIEGIKGESSLPSVIRCVNWISDFPGGIECPEGARFQLLRAMSKKARFKTEKTVLGYEPELDLPSGSTGESCLAFDFTDPKQDVIKDTPRFIDDTVPKTFTVRYSDTIILKPDTDYDLSLFTKGTGFSDTKIVIESTSARFLEKKGNEERYNSEVLVALKQGDFSLSSSWNPVKKKVRFTKTKGEKTTPEEFNLSFVFTGEGSFYLDDVLLTEKPK